MVDRSSVTLIEPLSPLNLFRRREITVRLMIPKEIPSFLHRKDSLAIADLLADSDPLMPITSEHKDGVVSLLKEFFMKETQMSVESCRRQQSTAFHCQGPGMLSSETTTSSRTC